MHKRYAGMTLSAAKRLLTKTLNDAGFDDSRRDATCLIGHILNLNAAEIIAQSNTALSAPQSAALYAAAQRRLAGEPVDLILGYRDFWKDRFTITADVLSPRPETEGIIEAALKLYPPAQNPKLSILELGAGSGALILSLLREYSGARATAVDLSEPALAVARGNAKALGLACDFMQSDWFENVSGPFDLIVSNPPYISDVDMNQLPREVARYDPHLALSGGPDGLFAYRIIAQQAKQYLAQSGHVIFEIGHRQARDISAILRNAGFDKITVHKDLAGHDRIITAQK